MLPFAIDRRAAVAVAPRPDGVLRLCSDRLPDELQSFAADTHEPGGATGWAAYAVGAAWALRQAGHEIGGADIAVSSTVPIGAGLSSSAALECATALALAHLNDLELPRPALARIAHADEHDFVGVPCGLMDQMASAAATAGTLLFFDVGNDHTEQVSCDLDAANLSVLVIDTRAHHSLADGQYGERREQCEQAARRLGVPNLAAVPAAELESALRTLNVDVLRRRVRHVVSENDRVRRVVDLLATGRLRDIGPALTASHRSLRDDFEVSCPELDLAVDSALRAGALGARMIGGGFGGSAIALVERPAADSVADAVGNAFSAAGFRQPATFAVAPSDGARVELCGRAHR